MPSASKRKGNTAEREVVDMAKEHGFEDAQRAYASNGLALGEAESVDVALGNGVRIQVKRRKSIADYLKIPEGCDVTFWRADREEWHVTITAEDFFKLLKDAGGW